MAAVYEGITMSCPLHPDAKTTKRSVPIETYSNEDVPPLRISGAEMETCTQCGASFYDWGVVAKLPIHTPELQPPPVHDYDS